jgi:acyl-coenzyme A synthetase/AMP-(fatty) acid ligase/pimeloyl-ACP methyl ester carboxylesterase
VSVRPDDATWRRWGIDPAWSTTREVSSHDGGVHRWHVLERPATSPRLTLVCVHGNPTWSYLWHSFLASSFHEQLGVAARVVAPDQLGMGYSDRVGRRRYADRVADLDDLVGALDVTTPIVLVAHDWGGAIAMGWAVDHPERVAGMVLANTGIAVPAGRRAPALIRLAATRGVLDLVCRRTPTFVRGTTRLSHGRIPAPVREALAAPYRDAADRTAIAEFVGDVPFDDAHPSAAPIARVADRLGDLDTPVLLAWGGRDPVFDDDFADDLTARLRHVDVHRFGSAGHLVVVEDDVSSVAAVWLRDRVVTALPRAEQSPAVAATSTGAPERPSLWAGLERRADDRSTAFFDGATGRRVSFSQLHRQVAGVAADLVARGVRPGDRVAILVPPSVETVAAVYGCWRAGAVTVVADRGLGLRGLGRAVRGARVDWILGPRSARLVAAALRWAPRAGVLDVDEVMTADGVGGVGLDVSPSGDDPAAVLFTSGATGPAKGVRYTHAQLAAQRDALTALYGITADDRFVAAFAPFALYGPALGIASAIPDADVTRPGRLTARALDDACRAIEATMVFASPAALANVVETAAGSLDALGAVRTVMSAGAPVPPRTLRAMAALVPAATLHTPYGMTECLPVADIDLVGIDDVAAVTGPGAGVCVGPPVPGCRVAVAPLGFDAGDPVELLHAGVTGEILVSSPWTSDGYDRAWATQRAARPLDAEGHVWHRTGDVGHLDREGRLWIEGRSVHVVRTATADVTPVPVEVACERLDGVRRAAAVGVGPVGIQQLVVVVEGAADGLADTTLTNAIRTAVADATGARVAAVCTVTALPVDIRHNAKIDRTAVAARAAALLAGSTR